MPLWAYGIIGFLALVTFFTRPWWSVATDSALSIDDDYETRIGKRKTQGPASSSAPLHGCDDRPKSCPSRTCKGERP